MSILISSTFFDRSALDNGVDLFTLEFVPTGGVLSLSAMTCAGAVVSILSAWVSAVLIVALAGIESPPLLPLGCLDRGFLECLVAVRKV